MDSDWSSISAQLHGSFLDRQVRRTNRNLFLFSLLIIIGVVCYGVAEWRYFYNFFAGPFEVGIESLNTLKYSDEQSRYFLRVRGQESEDSGLQEVEQETTGGSVRSETVKAKYYILIMGKRLLIVKAGANEKGAVFEGALGELPSDVRSEIVTPLVKEHPNANEAFLPLLLDATGFRNDGYIALVVCVPLLIFAMFLIRRVVMRTRSPEKHPIIKGASFYGTLADTSQRLDTELRGDILKVGKATLTQSWVLLPSAFGLRMCHIPDLIWAYQKVTSHYHYFVPTGKSYEVIMYDRYGKPLQLQTKKKKVETLLNYLVERAPWAVFGYNDQLSQTLRTNWGGFVAAVDAKKATVTSAV